VTLRTRCRPTSARRLAQRLDQNGFVLPASLLMVLLIAALVAGAFNATSEETKIGAAAADRQVALLAAESAIETTIAAPFMSLDGSMRLGETRSTPIDGLGAPVVVHVTRLGSSLYWLVSEAGGAPSNSEVARRIGVAVKATRGPDGSITIDRIGARAWSELF
jgi:hypothetical protein